MNSLVGTKFGKWTLLKEIKHDSKFHDTRYECICDCGVKNIVRRWNLKTKRSQACRSCSKKKHGYVGTTTYVVWEGMVKRCTNPKTRSWKYYGGRGIKVAERWLKFENFLKDMGERPIGKELDRKNNDGDYCFENCHWVTKKENMNNRTCSIKKQ